MRAAGQNTQPQPHREDAGVMWWGWRGKKKHLEMSEVTPCGPRGAPLACPRVFGTIRGPGVSWHPPQTLPKGIFFRN